MHHMSTWLLQFTAWIETLFVPNVLPCDTDLKVELYIEHLDSFDKQIAETANFIFGKLHPNSAAHSYA